MHTKEKVCKRCKKKKPINEFHKNKTKGDGHQGECKICCSLYYKVYRLTSRGREAKKRGDEKYNNSLKNKETKRRYAKSDKGREVSRDSLKRFFKSPKGKRAAIKTAEIRRTRKTKAGGTYSHSQWYNLCAFYGFCCLRCYKRLSFEELTFDHVKPVSKGGSSFIANAQPLCKICNQKKGSKEIDYRKVLPDWIDRNNDVWIQDTLFQWEEFCSANFGIATTSTLPGLPDMEAAQRDLCPECGQAPLVFEESCKKCYNCGYSEC